MSPSRSRSVFSLKITQIDDSFGFVLPDELRSLLRLEKGDTLYVTESHGSIHLSKFKPMLEEALASNKPCVIDVRMENAPVVTWGCWNINDIYRKRGEDKPWRQWQWEETAPWYMEGLRDKKTKASKA